MLHVQLDLEDEALAEDIRRCLCIRVGSMSGMFASLANKDNTVQEWIDDRCLMRP